MKVYVAQWQRGDGTWTESVGANGENQQAHYAGQAGIGDSLSENAARHFAHVLLAAGSYAPGKVRIVERTDRVIFG